MLNSSCFAEITKPSSSLMKRCPLFLFPFNLSYSGAPFDEKKLLLINCCKCVEQQSQFITEIKIDFLFFTSPTSLSLSFFLSFSHTQDKKHRKRRHLVIKLVNIAKQSEKKEKKCSISILHYGLSTSLTRLLDYLSCVSSRLQD